MTLSLPPLTSDNLTLQSASDLADAIRTGRTSAREVMEAHLRIYADRPWMNALAEERFEEALVEADEVDTLIQRGTPGLSDLPLLGVPVSVKELIAVKGLSHTAGMAHRRGHRAVADAPAVARLRAAGAIIVGVGNAPGPVFWIETNNAFYGRTANAYDPRRTAGGSSGGEGAGVGSGAVPVALGSDMAGSIRIPAHLNGVFGHLPTPGLIPNTGHYPMLEGDFRRLLWFGPLTRRASDLHLMLQVLAGPHRSDPTTRPIDLLEPSTVELSGMRVVVGRDTSFTGPRADLAAAQNRAAEHLAAQGAVVAEESFTATRAAGALFFAQAIAEADTAAMMRTIIAPASSRPDGTARQLPGVPLVPATVLAAAESAPIRFLRNLSTRRLVAAAQRAAEQTEELLQDGVLLTPPFPRVAPRHRSTAGQIWLTHSTLIFNVLGLPTTQIPLGLDGRGLPLGVQASSAAGTDHRTIAVALELERAFGGWTPPPNRSA